MRLAMGVLRARLDGEVSSGAEGLHPRRAVGLSQAGEGRTLKHLSRGTVVRLEVRKAAFGCSGEKGQGRDKLTYSAHFWFSSSPQAGLIEQLVSCRAPRRLAPAES